MVNEGGVDAPPRDEMAKFNEVIRMRKQYRTSQACYVANKREVMEDELVCMFILPYSALPRIEILVASVRLRTPTLCCVI